MYKSCYNPTQQKHVRLLLMQSREIRMEKCQVFETSFWKELFLIAEFLTYFLDQRKWGKSTAFKKPSICKHRVCVSLLNKRLFGLQLKDTKLVLLTEFCEIIPAAVFVRWQSLHSRFLHQIRINSAQYCCYQLSYAELYRHHWINNLPWRVQEYLIMKAITWLEIIFWEEKIKILQINMRNETVFGLIKDLIFQLHLKDAFRKLYNYFCKMPTTRGILSVYKFITSSVLLSSTSRYY